MKPELTNPLSLERSPHRRFQGRETRHAPALWMGLVRPIFDRRSSSEQQCCRSLFCEFQNLAIDARHVLSHAEIMEQRGSRTGLLIILSSPSGAGKSTLAQMLLAWDKDIRFSVSVTTRPPREGEKHGQHYFFETPEKFEEIVKAGEMLEHAEVFGNRYGSLRGPVRASIDQGKDILFDVDWQGGAQLRASSLARYTVSIFILPPSLKELRHRLITRGKDSAEVIARRMQTALSEISHWEDYDYVLINDDLDRCFLDLKTIIRAERLKRERNPQLQREVASYLSEGN